MGLGEPGLTPTGNTITGAKMFLEMNMGFWLENLIYVFITNFGSTATRLENVVVSGGMWA
jgi:hypothetical protein